jgi:hypothetical protein
VRLKQQRDAFEQQKQDLEAGLRKAMESRRGVERALEEVVAQWDDALSNL